MSNLSEILATKDFKGLIQFVASGRYWNVSRAIRRAAVSYVADVTNPKSPQYWKEVSRHLEQWFGIRYSAGACRMMCKRLDEQK